MHGQLVGSEAFCTATFLSVAGSLMTMPVPRLVASLAPHDGHVPALDLAAVGPVLVGLAVGGSGSLSQTQFTSVLTLSPPPRDLFLLQAPGTTHMILTSGLPFPGMGTSLFPGLYSQQNFSPMGLTPMDNLVALHSNQVGLQ